MGQQHCRWGLWSRMEQEVPPDPCPSLLPRTSPSADARGCRGCIWDQMMGKAELSLLLMGQPL